MKTDQANRPKWRRFMVSPRLEALREECELAGRGFGNRMTEIVTRYDALIAHYSPRERFSARQWADLLAIFAEHWPRADLAAATPEHIRQVVRHAGNEDLAAMVAEMDLAETTALIENVYRDLIARNAEPQGVSWDCR